MRIFPESTENIQAKGVSLPKMKDYYLILGLPRAADKKRIKQAYRDKAKQLHPDGRGQCEEDRKKFQEATEAYETLANDARRAEYDRKLQHQQAGATEIPVRKARDPCSDAGGRGRRVGRKPQSNEAFSEFEDGPFYNRELRLQLFLSPAEAAKGGRFALSVPLARPCPYCSRGVLLEQIFCPACGGRGFIRANKTVTLEVPAGIENRSRLRQIADEHGGCRTYLLVTVLIESGS
ncbi:MAG: DnaJ domain-containing protein [Desulfosalsimonadaceae bacterium]